MRILGWMFVLVGCGCPQDRGKRDAGSLDNVERVLQKVRDCEKLGKKCGRDGQCPDGELCSCYQRGCSVGVIALEGDSSEGRCVPAFCARYFQNAGVVIVESDGGEHRYFMKTDGGLLGTTLSLEPP